MSALQSKSIIQLRGIAQSFDIPDIFKKDAQQLIQAIEIRKNAVSIKETVVIPVVEVASLENVVSQPEIEDALREHIKRGLRLTFTDTQWLMACSPKNDQGSLSMPLRHIVRCADGVMG